MRKFLTKFRNSRSGLAYIWGIAICTLIFFPVIYWVLSISLDGIATTVFSQYTLLGAPASAWLLAKAIISALPVFVLFIVLAYSAVNAKAQAYEQ